MMRQIATLLTLGLVMGCASPDPARVIVQPETSTMKRWTRARSIEVGEVSLPGYAAKEDISILGADGLVMTVPNAIWADEPERTMTRALVRNLAAITRAKVAAKPWPLTGFADAQLSIRVERMLVQASGSLALTGQFAISREEGEGTIRSFSIESPVPTLTAAGIAQAHDTAWRQLAEHIARAL